MFNLKFSSIISAAAMLFSFNYVKAQLPSSDPAYQLVWADTFNTVNGYKINTSKWNQTAFGGLSDSIFQYWNGSRNIPRDIAYQKWYLPVTPVPTVPAPIPPDTTNCQVTGGYLNLYTRKETGYFSGDCWTWPHCNEPSGPFTQCNVLGNNCTIYPTDTFCWHSQYKQFKWTTANLTSKTYFRYGYFEIRFNMPTLPTSPYKYVTGPSFWLFNGNTDLVAGDSATDIIWSEIDIFEINGANDFTTNLHYTHEPFSANYSEYYQGYDYGIISAGWHTAGLLWTSDGITSYLDGTPIKTLDKSTGIRPDSLLPMPLIIGIASPNGPDSLTNPYAVFPYQFQVDYVKVWQIKQNCGTAQSYCSNFPLATYNSELYQSITMDGTGCTDSITHKSFLSLYGNNYVLLNPGFSIDNNSTVLMNVLDCPSADTTFVGAAPPQPPPASYINSQSNHINN